MSLPPALRARLTDDANRLRVPTWEQLQTLSPEERRLVVDYFRKLSEAPVRRRGTVPLRSPIAV